MKRLFIAVDISAEARQRAASYTWALTREFPRLRVGWERPEKLHLTLKFLGDVGDQTVGALSEVLRGIGNEIRPFEIRVGGTGVFPNVRAPRVLWLGVSEAGELRSLAGAVDTACSALGFVNEKRAFSPHLTIARLRDPDASRELAEAHLSAQFEPVTVEVNEFVLYESELLPNGSVYRKNASFQFSQ